MLLIFFAYWQFNRKKLNPKKCFWGFTAISEVNGDAVLGTNFFSIQNKYIITILSDNLCPKNFITISFYHYEKKTGWKFSVVLTLNSIVPYKCMSTFFLAFTLRTYHEINNIFVRYCVQMRYISVLIFEQPLFSW